MLQARRYTVKAISGNPSQVLHRAMNREEDFTITFRGAPAVRPVPVEPAVRVPSSLDVWEAMPDVVVARGPMVLPARRVTLSGPGPLASEMALEDRR
jgi:antitoxin (DNA-binding transcriptional repressor) of toxin-antitoxin stability system